MDKSDRQATRSTKKCNKSKSSAKIITVNSNVGEVLIEDDNAWECTVCTYRNSQEAFKCLMCDVRKGTSTRKPRINPELVAQQVARQQAQIQQKLLKASARLAEKEASAEIISNELKDLTKIELKESSKESKDIKEPREARESTKVARENRKSQEASEIKKLQELREGRDQEPRESTRESNRESTRESSKERKAKDVKVGKEVKEVKDSQESMKDCKESRETRMKNKKEVGSNLTNSKSSNEIKPNETEEAGPSAKMQSKSKDCNHSSSHNQQTIEPKVKLKNIDRTNFLAEAVTVNNVTVIITEFQPSKKIKTVKSLVKSTSKKD